MPACPCLFLPGWGAPTGVYHPGLPDGWIALQPPSFREAQGSLEPYRRWLAAEIDARSEPVVLAGHSMGGALALFAAAERPDRIQGIVLVSPAGLPLTKPVSASARAFLAQAADGRFALRDWLRALAGVLRAPRSALRVALAVRSLDLRAEMEAVARAGLPVTVIGCSSDTLVTVSHCRRTADLTHARYRELTLDGGHMWMFGSWPRLRHELRSAAR